MFQVFLSVFSAPAAAKTSVVTCCGRVAPVGVGDIVHLLEDTRYDIKKLFPDGRTCQLKKWTTITLPSAAFLACPYNWVRRRSRPPRYYLS